MKDYNFCEFGVLEPDYDSCPECNKPDPLQKRGIKNAKIFINLSNTRICVS